MSPLNTLLLGQADASSSAQIKLFTAAALAAVSLWLMIPGSTQVRRLLGTLVGLAALGTLGAFLAESPLSTSPSTMQVLFWLLTAATIVPAAGTICARSPVYAAILFALSLVGTAGLFLLQGAQFLGVATIVVYAGAIVVTFLFVVMLAQPDGQSTYDRIGWGKASKPLAVVAAMGMLTVCSVALLDYFHGSGQSSQLKMRERVEVAVAQLPVKSKVRKLQKRGSTWYLAIQTEDEAWRQAVQKESKKLTSSVEQELGLKSGELKLEVVNTNGDINHEQHVAQLGAQLFSKHLISIEVAGTLLLMALVGAVAIVLQNQPDSRRGEQ